ncbi:metallophosphoesterase [Streptomyces sp. NPDC090306]|uniref:metallophosphoesterase n=1 Tax=Streptomyces sp. NPDC090306 TaxID=3365961 RepID=UPI0037F6C06D
MAVVAVLGAVLATAVLVAVNRYVWQRLFRDTTRGPGWVRRAGAVLITGGWVLAAGALVAEQAGAPFPLQQALAWPGFLWLAVSVYLLLALLAGEAVRPLLNRLPSRRGPADPREAPAAEGPADGPGEQAPVSVAPRTATADRTADRGPTALARPAPAPAAPAPAAPGRRLFVARAVAGAAAVAAAGTVGYGTYGVLRGPRVRRVTVPLAKLPRSAHGFRIAVVSDIHLGPILGADFSRKVVDTVNSTQPDLIAVVGDLVDGSVADLGPAAAPLAGLTARHGTYFVTGNHEYFSGAEEWVRQVRRLGMRPLGTPVPDCPRSTSPVSTTSPVGARATGPTSRRRWTAGTRPARASCSPTSRCRSTTPCGTASTSSSPATPTADSSGPATTLRNWRIRPSRAWSVTGTRSCTSHGAPARGDRRPGWARRRTSR